MTKEQMDNEARKSTCQKRVTLVGIYDRNGRLLAAGSNRCRPDGGLCHRMGKVQTKENYDTESSCNWTHAEITAINNLPAGAYPHRSVLWGHDFYCTPCEEALRAAGVEVLEVSPESIC